MARDEAVAAWQDCIAALIHAERKECVPGADFCCVAYFDLNLDEGVARPYVEERFPIGPPARIDATSLGDPLAPARAREAADVDLVDARLIGHVRHPLSVGEKRAPRRLNFDGSQSSG